MKKTILLFFIIIVFTGLLFANAMPGYAKKKPLFAPDIVKVQLTTEAIQRTNLPQGLNAEARAFGIPELDKIMADLHATKVIRAHRKVKNTAWEKETGFDRWFLVQVPEGTDIQKAINSFKSNRYIQLAIPEYYAYTTAVPNDTYYANNWGHNNTAQLPVYSGSSHSGAGVGTIGFDSDAQLAWDQSQGYGSSSIIIAVIDTGVDTTHPDLRLVTGYDYGDNDSNPMDDSADPGHGTACSGVSAGMANNGVGVTGIAGGCSVMPLKVADSAGDMSFTSIENAITHAADHNADVISMSLGAEGGTAEGSSPSTDTALTYAYNAGVVIFAATANSDASTIAYPANHTVVISVGAASPTGQRKSASSSDGEYWWGSNYGTAVMDAKEAVDIMAPTILPATDLVSGGYSTTNYYMWFNGTSCATPYAAGVAALLLSKDPSLTPAQVRTAMTSTATDMTIDGGAGWDRYTGYGMVNANNALTSLIPGMPTCQITSPTGGSVFDLNSTISVAVTATDSDGTITGVAFYIDSASTPSYTDTSSPYTWSWNTTGQTGGAHTIKAVATDNSSNTAQSTVSVTLLAPANEGFETGNFTAYPWIQGGTLPWVVQSTDKYSGTYAAKSGTITHSQTSTMSVTLNITSAGNITFYQKVSSESGYDFLKFYIDTTETGSWSGAGSWTQQSYAVTTGSHTFQWTYSKDGSLSSNSDCAYLDHIIFPSYSIPSTFYPPQNLVAAAGNGLVNLSWQAPALGTPTGYKIYKNSTYLTTVTGLTYTDTAVVNGTTYSYYLIAAYSSGDSDPTSTVTATPSTSSTVTIGTGTLLDRRPLACYFGYERSANLFTAAEVGISGVIQTLAWYSTITPSFTIPTKIYLKTTTSTSMTASTWATMITGATLVYDGSVSGITANTWKTIDITDFSYTANNLLVLVECNYGGSGAGTSTGTQYRYSTSGTNMVQTWAADTSAPTGTGTLGTSRPNLQLVIGAVSPNPTFNVSPTSLAFGNVIISSTSVAQTLTVLNTGGGTLRISSTAKTGTDAAMFNLTDGNTYPKDLLSGQSMTVTVSFTPTSLGDKTAAIRFTDTLTKSTHDVALTGTGYNPTITTFPYNESFDGTTFAPQDWSNQLIVGTASPGIWDRQTAGTSPACTPHTGAGMARYNSYSITANTHSVLSTPPMNVPGSNYRVSFWIYRDASSSYNTTKYSDEGVSVWYGTSPTDTTACTYLGFVPRDIVFAPVVTAAGWYQYTYPFGVGSSGNGKYVIFKAKSQFGNNIFMDDVVVDALSELPVFNLNPASLDFGPIMTGQTATLTFTISNTGNALLTGNITTPTGYSVVQSAKLSRSNGERNSVSYSVAIGGANTYTVTFAPTVEQSYAGNISITSNDANHLTNSLPVTGNGYNPILDAPLQVEIQRQSGSVSLSWATVTNATTYYVYRSTTPGGTYTKIATVSTNSYIDTDSSSMTYFYYVAADRIVTK